MTDKAIIKGYCKRELCPTAKVIIKRHQAEIERLKDKYEVVYQPIAMVKTEAKVEAIKEFADRLKEKAYLDDGVTGFQDVIVEVNDIDNLVKEMVGDTE